jgi:S1-C subfamily serine protease/tetratricopeptide (TPR) repeat protein
MRAEERFLIDLLRFRRGDAGNNRNNDIHSHQSLRKVLPQEQKPHERHHMRKILILGLFGVFLCAPALPQDLRTPHGTQIAACSEAIDAAIKLSTDRQLQSALVKSEEALKFDPTCLMARLWRANILLDMGEFERAMADYEKVVEMGSRKHGEKVPISVMGAAFSMGLSLSKIEKTDDAAFWFTQLVLMDMKDEFQYHWKAYRNMAILSHGNQDDLSATIQALKAKECAPARVDDAMIRLLADGIKRQSTINILTLSRTPVSAEHPLRGGAPKLQRNPALENRLHSNLKVQCIARDSTGKRIVVCYEKAKVADIISCDRQAISTIDLPCAIESLDIAGDYIYASRAGLPGFVQLGFDGKLVRTYELSDLVTSLAVCPVTQQAFVSVRNAVLCVALDSGKSARTDMVGQFVSVDPRRQLAYSTYWNPPDDDILMPLIDNHPVFYSSMATHYETQNMIMKASYREHGDTALATIRLDAAVDGQTMDVSPDGRWVVVAGASGYHGPGSNGGNGVGVICAGAMDRLEGYYPIEGSLRSAAFNPGSDQIALASLQEVRVYNLGSTDTPFVSQGKYGKPLCWSGDGSLLLTAASTTGVHAFTYDLSAGERARNTKATDESDLKPSSCVGHPTPDMEPNIRRQRLTALQQYKPVTTLTAALDYAAIALRSTNNVALPPWPTAETYKTDAIVQNAVLKVDSTLDQGGGGGDLGIMLFQMNQVLRDRPDYLPAMAALGRLQRMTGKLNAAITNLTVVVTKDAGLTALTSDALCNLGVAYLDLGREPEAIASLTTGMSLDCGHVSTLDAIKPLLQKYKIALPPETAVAIEISATTAGRSMPAGKKGRLKLDLLPSPKTGGTLTVQDIFNLAASRVVVLQTGAGVGSGVCITDDGIILTCNHVLEARSGVVDVTLFENKDGKVTQFIQRKGVVVYRNPENDIALVSVRPAPDFLKGLPIAKEDAGTGSKVVVIGSPTMGAQVLSHTITEGIVSASERILDGLPFVQLSAAVNPGNSGGPLLSPQGEIVGLITLKASLENVGFAIPVSRIRAVLSVVK